MAKILEVENLVTHFDRRDGQVLAVDGITYSLEEGESLGIVGESGSGKSVGVMSLVQLLPDNGHILDGKVVFKGRDLLKMSQSELRDVRGREIGFVFQNPLTALDPTMRCGMQVSDAITWHDLMEKPSAWDRVISLLQEVGIPSASARARSYPFEFSGGMRQRVMIALGLSCEPSLIIADEPTSNLDVTIQAQIMELLDEMKKNRGTSTILITHDMGIAAEFSDKLMVMYAGRVAEIAPTMELLVRGRHPYTNGLLDNARMQKGAMSLIPGQPPDMVNPPSGCRFHPRCRYATDRCREEQPPATQISPDHTVYCWNPMEVN